MMYPFCKYPDETEVNFSNIVKDEYGVCIFKCVNLRLTYIIKALSKNLQLNILQFYRIKRM